MDKLAAKTLLFAVADALERQGITFFLDYGTLLGAIRESDFIEFDNDIDLGIFINIQHDYAILYSLVGELYKKGIKLSAIWKDSAISFDYGDISLDLNSYVKDGDQYVLSLFNKKSYYPARFLDELSEINFLNRKFNTPSFPSELLALGYGDNWKIPIQDKKPSNFFREDRHVDYVKADYYVPIYSKEWQLNRIPKLAHFYWGEKHMPYLRYKTIESFHKLNKDWVIRLYYPEYRFKGNTWPTHEQQYAVSGPDYYNELRKLPIEFVGMDFETIGVRNDISEVHKSDFLRWYLLSQEGGLWSDMDILYFKPMHELALNAANNKDFDTAACISAYGHSIGFMLASAHNKYHAQLFQRSKAQFSRDNYQSVGVVLLNKDFPTVETICNTFPNMIVSNIDMSAVYPYDATLINKIYQSNDMSRFTIGSIGLHWYAGHQLAGEAINQITGPDVLLPDNVLTRVLTNKIEVTACL